MLSKPNSLQPHAGLPHCQIQIGIHCGARLPTCDARNAGSETCPTRRNKQNLLNQLLGFGSFRSLYYLDFGKLPKWHVSQYPRRFTPFGWLIRPQFLQKRHDHKIRITSKNTNFLTFQPQWPNLSVNLSKANVVEVPVCQSQELSDFLHRCTSVS